MSQPRKRFQYDLAKISKFNHAAIYAFELSESVRGKVSQDPMFSLFHEVGQHEDMFNAYYYAQETVLKEIRQKGVGHINGDDILRWLNEAHRLMAYTVVNDAGMAEYAGQYSRQQIILWHQTTKAELLLNLRYLWETGYNNLNNFNPDIFNELLELNVDIGAAKMYLKMMHTYRDEDIALNVDEIKDLENYRVRVPVEAYQATLTTKKLMALYNNNKLSQEEKQTIDKLMKLGCPPEEIRTRMKNYADNLASAWNKCNGNNMDELTSLCYQGFQGETDIHAYIDFNGRLGAWLVNVICESLDRRSFLMRKTGDSSNPASDLERGMAHIDETSKYFKIFCAKGIRDAEHEKGYSNKNEEKVIALRVNLANKYLKFNAEFPNIDLGSWAKEGTDFIQKQLKAICWLASINANNLPQDQLQVLFFTFRLLNLAAYREQQRSSASSLATVSSVKYQYTDTEKQAISEWLCLIANIPASAYKMYNNGKILLEVDSLQAAENISLVLNLTTAMTAKEKYNPSSKSHVVLVENVRFKRFAKVVELKGWLDEKSENGADVDVGLRAKH